MYIMWLSRANFDRSFDCVPVHGYYYFLKYFMIEIVASVPMACALVLKLQWKVVLASC